MGVFAKLDGLKKPPPDEWSFGASQSATMHLKSASAQAVLSQVGISRSGVQELAGGKTISNEKDRALVAAIVSAALG